MRNASIPVLSQSTSAAHRDRRQLPFVSIIIPARNEAAHVAACLESLAQQDYPADRTEIILVDNGSTDETAAIAKDRGIRVLRHPSGLVGAVRNAGARASQGELIAFLDADCVAGKRWLAASVARLADPGVGASGGMYLADRHGNWVQRAWATTEAGPTTEGAALPGGSLVLRRETFEAIGGFNETLSAGEDDEICLRVRNRGLRVIADREACVIHLGYPRTLRAVARRQVWHGSHQLDVARSWREPQLLMTHAFALGMVLLPIFLISGADYLLLATALAAISGPVLVMAYTRSRNRSNQIMTCLSMIPVGLFFYLGRAAGLLLNYVAIARKR